MALKSASEGTLIQLPDGTFVTLITNRVQSFVKGVETFTGRVKDIDSGFFTLSIEKNQVFGQINIEYMAYDLQYDNASKSHVLTEIDQTKVPKHTPDPITNKTTSGQTIQGAISSTAMSSSMMSGSVNGTVRVLILYASDVNNINLLASSIIAQMNESFFTDSMDPDFHVTLAGIRNLNDNLAGVCKSHILDRMRLASAPFTNIDLWQNNENADVVLTIATTDLNVTSCPSRSYGRVGGIATMLNPNDTHAVSMDTYAIGDLTAVHELGHVLGGGHENWDVPFLLKQSPSSEHYARGYMSGTGNWQTMMGAYNATLCPFSSTLPNPDCVRILRWSNPGWSYSGETRGVTYTSDTQVPFSADMDAALAVHIPIVAAYKTFPSPAPAAVPGNFRVVSDNCYGLSTARWNSVSTAENYQLLQSTSSNFSNPSVIYFGSARAVEVTTTQNNILYLKVRACNGSGCGVLSGQKEAHYFNGCL